MGRGYGRSTATIAAATATSVASILASEGYTGSMVGAFLEIDPTGTLTDLYRGTDSTVSASTGVLLQGPFNRIAIQGRAVDPGGIWLFSTTGGDFNLTFEPL